MNETQQKIWNALCSMPGEKVVNLLTDIHGLRILNDDVLQELVDLGYVEDETEEE